MKKYYTIGDDKIYLRKGSYAFTGNTSIEAKCKDNSPFACLTVNLIPLESKDLAYLNINLFGIDIENFFVENRLGEKIAGRELRSGYLIYPLYKLNLKKL